MSERFWANPEEKIINWFDIAKGVGEVALISVRDLITKQFLHETPSEHFRGQDAQQEVDRG